MTQLHYHTLREKIAAEKKERLERYAAFEHIFVIAHAAGMKAGYECRPTPMVVGQPKSFFSSEIDYTKGPMYVVDDGACGFGWVNVPANTSFAKWLKKADATVCKRVHRGCYGGLDISCHEFGQSYERKSAYVGAFAKVLNENGIEARAQSRLD